MNDQERDQIARLEEAAKAIRERSGSYGGGGALAGIAMDKAMPSASTSENAGRMSARAVLEHRYQTLLREANALHALLQALPQVLLREADEALWQLAVNARASLY